jgi:hypothetical protein
MWRLIARHTLVYVGAARFAIEGCCAWPEREPGHIHARYPRDRRLEAVRGNR